MKALLTCCSFFVLIITPLAGDTGNVTKSAQSNEGNNSGLEKLALECHLRCEKDKKGVLAKVTFRNSGPASVRIWRRNLMPERRLSWSAFVITRNGGKVHYRGMTTKAAPPTFDDYVEIEPGGTRSAEIRLETYYDLGSPGRYRVQYRAIQPNLSDEKLSLALSNVIELDIP